MPDTSTGASESENAAPTLASPDTPLPSVSPSAVVTPFESAGLSGSAQPVAPKHTQGRLIITLVLILILVGAGSIAYWWFTQRPVAQNTSVPTPTPVAAELEKPLQEVDVSMGELDANLENVDPALGDKPGDLSE
jgi:hypothetical protein